jgi:hypothetical protein
MIQIGRVGTVKHLLLMISFCGFLVLAGVHSLCALTIGGAVKQPLTITTDGLSKMEAVSARVSELSRDKQYRGTFVYRGIPLKSLLELVDIQKDKTSVYPKPIDLAIVVTDKDGRKIALSWGEVFYRNPAEILIATSATPIGPHHTDGCGDCHGPEVFQPALDQLKRKVGYPKLVVVNDFFTDRSIEDVVKIEVVDFRGQSPKKEMKKLFSPKFVISHGGKNSEFSELGGSGRSEVVQKEVGDGRGYHGLKRFGGVPLRAILAKAGAPEGVNYVVLASAPDGYRALYSFGELFLRPEGERILVADTLNGIRLDADGRFIVIPPDDLAADRDVKAVEKIEVVPVP